MVSTSWVKNRIFEKTFPHTVAYQMILLQYTKKSLLTPTNELQLANHFQLPAHHKEIHGSKVAQFGTPCLAAQGVESEDPDVIPTSMLPSCIIHDIADNDPLDSARVQGTVNTSGGGGGACSLPT